MTEDALIEMDEENSNLSMRDFFKKGASGASPAPSTERKNFTFQPVQPAFSAEATDSPFMAAPVSAAPEPSPFPAFTVEAGPVSPTFSAHQVAQVESTGFAEMPAFQAPEFQAPAFETPTFEAPMVETPAFAAPAPIEQWSPPAPILEAPVYAAPVYEAPVDQAPAYEAPVFQEPALETPAFTAPVPQPHSAAHASDMVLALPSITIPNVNNLIPDYAPFLMPSHHPSTQPVSPAKAVLAPVIASAGATSVLTAPPAPAPEPVEIVTPISVEAEPEMDAPQPVANVASFSVQAAPAAEQSPASLHNSTELYRYEPSWQKTHIRALEAAEKNNEVVVNSSNISSKLQDFLAETVQAEQTKQKNTWPDSINPAAINSFHAALYEGIATREIPASPEPAAPAAERSPLSVAAPPEQSTGQTSSRFSDRLKMRIENTLKGPIPAVPQAAPEPIAVASSTDYHTTNHQPEVRDIYTPPPYPVDPSKEQ